MNDMERLIVRLNELGLAVGVAEERLVIEGDTRSLTNDDLQSIARLKPELVAYLSEPREHVAILCRHRQTDGRACGQIVTVQRPSGKVAWCQTCYPQEEERATLSGEDLTSKPCYCCGQTDWWITTQGHPVCRTCHPPATPELECPDAVSVRRSRKLAAFDCREVVPEAPHVILPLFPVSAPACAGTPAMWVSRDLNCWVTDTPPLWSDNVTIEGKEFVKLTPSVLAWLKERVSKAEAACNRGKIAPEAFERIVKAFCPIYEFAVRTGMVPDPVPRGVRDRAAEAFQ